MRALFQRIRERGATFDPDLWTTVGRIVDDVALRGDEALFDYTARWDGHAVTAATVEASPEERRDAAAQVAPEDLAILRLAAGRIGRFHERQRQEGGRLRTKRGWSSARRSCPWPVSASMRRGIGLRSLDGPDDGDSRPDRRRRRDHPGHASRAAGSPR